jgi:predicted nucleic acid-binding protein
VIVLDTSGLLAWIDSSQRRHGEVVRAMAAVPPPFLLSPFVLAELDYLLATRVGDSAERALLAEVARGAFQLESFATSDVRQALAVVERYQDLRLGLADASLVVLAHRYRTRFLLTLDERHFRTLRGLDGAAFELLP